MPGGTLMTQVNLLPGDTREKNRTRRVTATVVSAVGAVVALLLFVFVLQTAGLSRAQRELNAQREANGELQLRIQSLQKFADLKQKLSDRQALQAILVEREVLFSGVMGDLSKVTPGQMYLTSLSATLNEQVGATSPPTTGTPVAAPTLIGSIQFQGVASDQPTIALWLTRLESVTGWVNSWITSDVAQDSNGLTTVQFTGTVDLTVDATTQNGVKR
jgi:Tfp pilus assembly protein PilN